MHGKEKSNIEQGNYTKSGLKMLIVVNFNLAPACLEDKSLGVHNYVTTKSKVKFHYVANGEVGKPLMLCLHGFPEVVYSALFY
jgi:hypothetical protein